MADGDGAELDPFDLLQQELEALPKDGHPAVLKFRFDPGGARTTWKPPLDLRRDEDVETQVARHIEVARLPAGKYQLRLCFKGAPVRQATVDLPGCSLATSPTTEPSTTSPDDKSDAMARFRKRLEDRVMRKVEEALDEDGEPDEDEDEEEEEEEEQAPPAPEPEPLWLQAVKSEKAQGVLSMALEHLNTFLEAKAGQAVAERRVAEARAEQVTGEAAPKAPAEKPVQRVRLVSRPGPAAGGGGTGG